MAQKSVDGHTTVGRTAVSSPPIPVDSNGGFGVSGLSIRGSSRLFPVALTGSPKPASYAVENSRTKVQNVVTDSSAEIAAILGITEGAVMMRRLRAFRRLSQLLNPDSSEE
ncbi:MAG: RNA polymerase sigma factor [Planctomycetota bacterium]